MYRISVKTLSLSDYDSLKPYEAQYKESLSKNNRTFRKQHQHRDWEYMGAVEYLNKTITSPKNILDIGGCGAPFPYYIKDMTGANVTVIDPDTNSFNDFGIKYIQKIPSGKDFAGYDFISCISVIEHVPSDKEFLQDVLQNMDVGSHLYLTCDWHESGRQLVQQHERTYNRDMIEKLLEGLDITISFDINRETHVYNYNFARILINKI